VVKIVVWKARISEVRGEKIHKWESECKSFRTLMNRLAHVIESSRALEIHIIRTYLKVSER
jgi:hypothetical protein